MASISGQMAESTRLARGEQRFAELGERLDDSPVAEALATRSCTSARSGSSNRPRGSCNGR